MLLQLVIYGVPVLAFPGALILGFRKTIWLVMAMAVLVVIVPYIYFGIWGLWEGVSLSAVFDALRLVSGAYPVILAYMVLWSVVFAAAGAGLRYGWQRWRTA